MNKSELVKTISEKTSLPEARSAAALNAMISIIEETVSSGEPVAIPGFGSFRAVTRHPRKDCPRIGREVKIPAKPRPVFRPGKAFREKVGKRLPL